MTAFRSWSVVVATLGSASLVDAWRPAASRFATRSLCGHGPRDVRQPAERGCPRHQRCGPGRRLCRQPRVHLAERPDDRPVHRHGRQWSCRHQQPRPGRRQRPARRGRTATPGAVGQRDDDRPDSRTGGQRERLGQRHQRFPAGGRRGQLLGWLPVGERRADDPGTPRRRRQFSQRHQQCRASGRLVLLHRSDRRSGRCRMPSSGRTAS